MNIALSLNSGIGRRFRVGIVALGVSCLTAHLASAQANAPSPSTPTESVPAAEATEPERSAERQARPWLAEPHKKPLATAESAPFPWKSAVLLVGVASLGALAWRRRKSGRSHVKADRSARLSVLDSVRVGPRAQLVLTRIGDRTLLLGVTEDSVRRIAWIDQPATGSAQTESPRSDSRHFLDVMRAEGARAERAARASSRSPAPALAASAAALPAPASSATVKSAPEQPMVATPSGATSSPPEAASPSTTAPVAATARHAEPTFDNAALEIAKTSNDTVEWSRGAASASRPRRTRSVSSEKAAKAVLFAQPAPKIQATDEPLKPAPTEEPITVGPTTVTISESRALDPNKAALPSDLRDAGMEGQAAGVVQRRSRRRL
jgi:flagellar biogenesis protein FliO